MVPEHMCLTGWTEQKGNRISDEDCDQDLLI